MAKVSKKLLGATKARLHSPLLKGKNYGQEISDLSESIGIPLLPWQRWVLDDMTTVDKDGAFIRRTLLAVDALNKIGDVTEAAGLGAFAENRDGLVGERLADECGDDPPVI